jgi:hypothetical protein
MVQVPVGGRHHPAVHLDGPGAPHPLHHPLLQHPQQLHLHAGRHLAHLVQEDGAPVGLFELPRPGSERVRVGPFLVAEDLRLQQGLGNGAAVHHHERPVGPAALQVDGPGHQFLARAALPDQQHRGVRGGHDGGHPQDLQHGGARPHHPVEPVRPGQVRLQPGPLLPQPTVLRQLQHPDEQPLLPPRTREEVQGPVAHRDHRLLHGARGVHDEHRTTRIGGHQFGYGLRVRGDHHVGSARILLPAYQDTCSLLLEPCSHGLQQALPVVYQEDV